MTVVVSFDKGPGNWPFFVVRNSKPERRASSGLQNKMKNKCKKSIGDIWNIEF